jgi:hypothetical protein
LIVLPGKHGEYIVTSLSLQVELLQLLALFPFRRDITLNKNILSTSKSSTPHPSSSQFLYIIKSEIDLSSAFIKLYVAVDRESCAVFLTGVLGITIHPN